MDEGRPKILFLPGKMTDRDQVLASLAERFQIELFEDVDEAMSALRSGAEYHAVFADVGDFLPLERALVDQQASLVLNTIGEGVCVLDDVGRCVWANQRMQSFPAAVYERVQQLCISAHRVFAAQSGAAEAADLGKRPSRKFAFQVGDHGYFETFVSPIIDDRGHVRQVVAVVWDASSGRRLQQKLDAIDSAGRELVRLESESLARMSVTDRLKLLEDKIIRYTRDLMRFDNFIIRLLNKQTNQLEPVISSGLPSEALEVDLYAEPEGNGISGWVAATGRSYVAHDVEKDARYVLGLGHAKSSLTVPLRLHDKIIGVFNVESQQPGNFTEDDRQFAEIFGRYIALALNILDLMVVERYTTSGRLTENVARELAGPLNDISTDAQALVDEYIGHDELRRRLGEIVDRIDGIRGAVRDLSQGPKTVEGADRVEKKDSDPLKGRKILVADDEPNIRNTIAQVLEKLGCVVTTCKDGHEAVNQIEAGPFDLIVSDIRMPHRNGYEIFAAA
ncbi:MAG: response regulator, partial [Phycisphaerae bacterium]|nr:response regulator [Phycisphaerae bacterium]